MIWIGDTPVAARCRLAFEATLSGSSAWRHDHFNLRATECKYRIVVVDKSGGDSSWAGLAAGTAGLLESVARSWKDGGWSAVERLIRESACGLTLFDPMGEASGAGNVPRDRILLRCLDPFPTDLFVALVAEDTYTPIRLSGLLRMVGCWQVEQRRLPLHAAGVDLKGRGFVFLGRSGAGKSTIAKMSAASGARVIDDDQVLAVPVPGAGWVVEGWPTPVKPSAVPLEAAFFLVQAERTELRSIPKSKGARLLLERYWDLASPGSAGDSSRAAFALACELARSIPTLELRFTQSPDFWEALFEEGLCRR